MQQDDTHCVHCNLPVKISGFVLYTLEGKKYFCCEGCKIIFKIYHSEICINDNSNNQIVSPSSSSE